MVHFVYEPDPKCPGRVHPYLEPEYTALQELGASVSLTEHPDADRLVLRASIDYCQTHYPRDERYVHNLSVYRRYAYLSHYYHCIADLTIETYFVDALDHCVDQLLEERGWTECFVKNDMFALEHIQEGLSIYPRTSLADMSTAFAQYAAMPPEARYAIRRRVAKSELEGDERYFVIGDRVYHRSGVVPEIVLEGARRLRTLGGYYFVIDATPEMIIEVNPGESSDRHAVNPPELFASWLLEGICD